MIPGATFIENSKIWKFLKVYKGNLNGSFSPHDPLRKSTTGFQIIFPSQLRVTTITTTYLSFQQKWLHIFALNWRENNHMDLGLSQHSIS